VTEPAAREPGVTEPAAREPGATAPVRVLFDAKAATWAAKYAPGGALTGRRSRLTAAVSAQAGPGARVLDLGCGSGDLARHLAEAGLRVTGCDISRRMLEQAERADPAGTWVTLDPAWRVLPFGAGAFSAVIASSVLEYVTDPVTVLRECARVLVPGGAVLCTVPDTRHPVRWLEWPAARCATLLGPVLGPVLGPRAAASGGSPGRAARLRGYVGYLQVSRQRHSARWWAAAAGRAGLLPAAVPGPPGAREPLRLLGFRTPAREALRPG
jgi:SAM-dependent methyltransferase